MVINKMSRQSASRLDKLSPLHVSFLDKTRLI